MQRISLRKINSKAVPPMAGEMARQAHRSSLAKTTINQPKKLDEDNTSPPCNYALLPTILCIVGSKNEEM
jgi:hypothetical protein